jgi:hypothetical protein
LKLQLLVVGCSLLVTSQQLVRLGRNKWGKQGRRMDKFGLAVWQLCLDTRSPEPANPNVSMAPAEFSITITISFSKMASVSHSARTPEKSPTNTLLTVVASVSGLESGGYCTGRIGLKQGGGGGVFVR